MSTVCICTCAYAYSYTAFSAVHARLHVYSDDAHGRTILCILQMYMNPHAYIQVKNPLAAEIAMHMCLHV